MLTRNQIESHGTCESLSSTVLVDQDHADDDDDDDDEDDQSDDRLLPCTRNGKRYSVFAEIVDETQDDVMEVKKTADEKMRILELLQRQVLFKHLEEEQRELVARAMSVVEYKSGEHIVKQGEDGDAFYLVDCGAVEGWRNEELIHTYGPGGAFGELALMYNAPRAATCRAASDCRLYALGRKVFKVILMKTSNEKRSQTKSILQNVDILKQLTEVELLTMADSMQEVVYEEGDVICRQGDAGSSFYIIKQGGATCTQVDAQGQHREVARLTVGDYFGEIALLTTKPRQATVTATKSNGGVKLLSLERCTFNRIIGSIEDILRRNMAAYNKFQSGQI